MSKETRACRKIHGAAVRELEPRKASICDTSKEIGVRRRRLKHHRPWERKAGAARWKKRSCWASMVSRELGQASSAGSSAAANAIANRCAALRLRDRTSAQGSWETAARGRSRIACAR